MIDPSSLLRAADPLRDDSEGEGLSSEDAQAIRQAMLRTHAAIPDVAGMRAIWRRPLPLAAAAALIASVTGIVGDRFLSRPEFHEPVSTAAAPVASGDAEKRQLQFATPGGTRIIWVFDDNLRLQEPIP
jgi:hypothetical protein